MNEVLNKFHIIQKKKQSLSLRKILTPAKFENIYETPAAESSKSQDLQPVLYYRNPNSLNSKTANISTYIRVLHVKVPIQSTL